MPADLERQLTRFAESLDREAGTISVDEIVRRDAVTVDLSRRDRRRRQEAEHAADAVRGADPGHGGDGADRAVIELGATSAAGRRRRGAWHAAVAAAAAAVVVVALGGIVGRDDEPGPASVPPVTPEAPPSSTIAPAPPTTQAIPTATPGAMWPQSTLEEVRAAQARADQGDPDVAWQVGARLVEDDPLNQVEAEVINRFLREGLGWEAYLFQDAGTFSNWQGAGMDGWVEGTVTGLRYLRCAPGGANPLYPASTADDEGGPTCAPTIDDRRYERVSIDIAQLVRQGPDGVWVVRDWEIVGPFEQADPVVVEADGRARLAQFLDARVAGAGAEGVVWVPDGDDVPNLYASSSGAPYERYEIERLPGVRWPEARMTFAVRLFTVDGTVVEQQFGWSRSAGLWLEDQPTIEDGAPIAVVTTSADGAVTLSAPDTWARWLPGRGAGRGGHEQALDVWFGAVWRREDFFGGGERIELVDPVAYDAWCAANGGIPLLDGPADAAAIVQQLADDPNFETTAPVATSVGRLAAVSLDVTLAPGGTPCGVGMIEISRWVHGLWEPGWRLRLYLVDLPAGMPVQTMAITVVAPDDRFDDLVAETAPIIESIEFRPTDGAE